MKKFKLSVTSTKWLKSFHIFFASTWGGSASSIFAVHCLLTPASGPELYARNMALIYMDYYVIFPSIVGCFITGLLYSQFTRWGYFRYYWVISKWLVLFLLIGAGILWFIPMLEEMAAHSNTLHSYVKIDPSYHATMDVHSIMAVGQMIIVFLMMVVSVFKPWGMVRKG